MIKYVARQILKAEPCSALDEYLLFHGVELARSYLKLDKENYDLRSKLKLAEIEIEILKLNGKAARNKDGI